MTALAVGVGVRDDVWTTGCIVTTVTVGCDRGHATMVLNRMYGKVIYIVKRCAMAIITAA